MMKKDLKRNEVRESRVVNLLRQMQGKNADMNILLKNNSLETRTANSYIRAGSALLG